MMQPRANIVERVQLWVVSQNDLAAPKSPRLFHNWTPVPKQSFEVSSSRATALEDISRDSLLRQIQKDVLRCFVVVFHQN